MSKTKAPAIPRLPRRLGALAAAAAWMVAVACGIPGTGQDAPTNTPMPTETPAPTPTPTPFPAPPQRSGLPDSVDMDAVVDRIREDFINPGGIYGAIPRDSIPPIYDPKVVEPEGADLREDDLVMGVGINGEARSYPVSIMTFREMVNDRLGGEPILVSW